MKFPTTITIEACEKFLKKMTNHSDSHLVIPVNTRSLAFGGLASAIQAMNTWVRHSDTRELILRDTSSENKENIISDLFVRPHKFVAAMCAKKISYSSSQGDDLRSIIYLQAKKTIEQQEQQPYGQQRGGLCWFSFVDHSTKAFNPNFYITHKDEQPSLRSEDQIESVICKMIKKTTETSGGSLSLSMAKSLGLGHILYELFLNTHEHGTRSNTRSQWLKPGVRTIYVNAINLDKTSREKMTNDQPPLKRYLSNKRGNLRARYVEIGVVDSGLGFCDRWRADKNKDLNDPIEIDNEYGLFKECFKFRQTSTRSDGKGNGLPAVLEQLTKLRGFVRIRSGRLALFRDFINSPFEIDDNCDFHDWVTKESAKDSITTLSKVAGVAISILIPLEDQ